MRHALARPLFSHKFFEKETRAQKEINERVRVAVGATSSGGRL